MAANFLHGVETSLVKVGPRPVNVVKSAVIGLIGLATIDPDDTATFDPTRTSVTVNRNKPFLVLNDTDGAKFGPEIPGFTIPQALDAIFDQGAGTVVVVNVFDPTKHLAAVSAETVAIANFKGKLAYPAVEDLVLSKISFNYVKDSHYLIDSYGNVTIIGDAISGKAATGSFTIQDAIEGSGNQITQITIITTDLLTSPVAADADTTAMATAVAAAITSGPSNYTATSSGDTVTILGTKTLGGTINGEEIELTVVNVSAQTGQEMSGGVSAAGSSITANYKRLDTSTIENADFIGDIVDDVRTGLEVFDLVKPLFGFKPRILIAPEYSQIPAIKTEMIVKAIKYYGFALIDAPTGWTPTQAITDRGNTGTIFNTSSYAAVGLYPRAKRYDLNTDADIVYPYSPFFAGKWAATINEFGYWYSPSNKELQGLTGIERTITADISDAQTDANLLNENGIVTFYNDAGVFTWGNRSLAYPTFTDPEQFLSIRMTVGVIKDSIEAASRQFIDQPIDNALIDTITETVNEFIRVLIGRGALVDGECFYDAAKNPSVQIAAGQLVLSIRYIPPFPLERLTFETFLDVNLLSSLGV